MRDINDISSNGIFDFPEFYPSLFPLLIILLSVNIPIRNI